MAYADLASPDVNALLKEHCKYANVRGIRQMLDYHPVEEKWRQAPHDRFLTDDAWLTGLKLMEQYNLSFDLQIHVPQMQVSFEPVKIVNIIILLLLMPGNNFVAYIIYGLEGQEVKDRKSSTVTSMYQ